MTQVGEAIAALFGMDDPKKKIKKEKLKIRFSLFFDGTNNNRNNIAAREKKEIGFTPKNENEKKELEAYKDNGDGESSYDNGRTNIAVMEPQVMPKQEGYDHYFKIYIEGQGTNNLESDDDLMGKGLGIFGSGVASRAEKGVREAVLAMQDYLDTKPPEEFEIEKIDVDVFGFSRGAAAARHSISLMLEWLAPDTIFPNFPLYKRIRVHGYDVTKKMVEVKFAGVYDTVVSVNASQLSYDAENKLNQRAIALATKSVHLCAAEEHRLDFPLHTIKSALAKGKGKELYLPGVHSDVGGSYNLANDLAKAGSTVKILRAAGSYSSMVEKKQALIDAGICTPDNLAIEITKRGMRRKPGSLQSVETPLEGKLIETRKLDEKGQGVRTTDEIDMVINCGTTFVLNNDREWLIKQGWYKPNEIVTHSFGMGYLQVNRRNIKSAYCNIPLKIMAKLATENGIKFEQKLNQRANQILNKQPDLQSLEASINNYIAKMGNDKSKPDDWIENAGIHHNSPKYPITGIRHDHLHMSARTTKVTNTKFGFSPRFSGLSLKRKRFYYDG